MNLCRSLSRPLSSSVTRKWSFYRSIFFLQSSSRSTETLNPKSFSSWGNPRSSEKFPRPSEIPFQAKVANSVHLVGTVGVPVQLRTLPNGIFAVSVLVQEKNNSPHLWIPVIFQGDLAQIASCHLKENDLIYVTGQLSGDVPALTVKDAETSSHVQVFVNTLSFVPKTFQGNEDVMPCGQAEVTSTSSGGMKEPNKSKGSLWDDLIENPQQWDDHRQSKLSGSVAPKYPDFKQKRTQQGLWLDNAPTWVLEKLDSLVFSDHYNIIENDSAAFTRKLEKGGMKEPNKSKGSLWSDLIEKPQQWDDHRQSKLSGSVPPKYPDFTQKSTQRGLWLNYAPTWVLEKLDSLVFSDHYNIIENDSAAFTRKLEKGGMKEPNKSKGSLWDDLIENPQQWDDHRQPKLSGSVAPKYPDFKQKSTQQGLWLDNAPTWVLEKLDSLVFSDHCNIIQNASAAFTRKPEKEKLWKDLVENPDRWRDDRSKKLKPKHPDFKHKDTGEALWLGSSTPSWVLAKLPPPLKSKQDVDTTKATPTGRCPSLLSTKK